MSATRLTVYSRPHCHLCDVMLAELRPLLVGRDTELEIVDIDQEETLRLRYGDKVPVLVADGEEVCHFRLLPDRVRQLLDRP